MQGRSEHRLSPLQRGMLFDQLASGTPEMDVLQVVGTLRERLDAPALARAWEQLVERHPSLRSHFRWEGLDEPLRLVDPGLRIPLELLDESEAALESQQGRVDRLMDADRARGFDLSRPPLARMTLVRFGPESHALILTVHHILMDALSFPVLLRELFVAYEAIAAGDAPALPAVGPEADETLAGPNGSGEEFWRSLLAGFGAPTLLRPGAAQGPAEAPWSRRGAARTRLSEETSDGLRRLASSLGVTLESVVQASWALLLSRYCGEDDVVFGALRRTRRAGEGEPVGLFINTLPMRVRLDPSTSLAELLCAVRAQHRAIGPHRHTPLVDIRRQSEIPGRTPLFDSFVVFNPESLDRVLRAEGGGWHNREFRLAESLSSIPFGLYVHADPRLELRLVYDRQRCDDASAARMLEHLECLLSGMPGAASQPAVALSMLTPAESRLLDQWNDTRRADLEPVCVHELIEERARAIPDAVALISGDGEITYRELDRQAEALASELRRSGVGPGVLVGIHLTRSIEMVVGILATLKAGGAYLPLDPAFPAARIAYMLEDAGARVVLSEPRLMGNLRANPLHVIEVRRGIEASGTTGPRTGVAPSPNDLAYVIYTSGSTGDPKGVMVEHRNVVNFFRAMDERIDVGSDGVWLAVTSLSFDISVLELLWTLTKGFRVVLYPGDDAGHAADSGPREIFRLGDWLERHGVTHMQCTPSLALMMTLDAACRDGIGALRQLLVGGEAFPASLAAELRGLTAAEITNMYGPTETTIWSSTFPIPAAGSGTDSAPVVPIGWPVRNTHFHVLDHHLQPVPPGLAGELYIGGDGVARGYLKRPALTRERFVPDPRGGRLYRTGDLVAQRSDGCLQFLGRIDDQLKVRGHRIEPAEIEHQLERHPGIEQAAVVACESGHRDKHLRACLIAKQGQEPSEDELRAHLRERLPDSMVPGEFLFLDELPLTPNKKLDRKALAALRPTPAASRGAPTPAREGLEVELAEIWQRLLGPRAIGRDANFFDLGGDSFLAMRLHHELRGISGGTLSLTDIFRYPTLRLLAERLGRPGRPETGVRKGIDRGRARRLRQQRHGEDGSS